VFYNTRRSTLKSSASPPISNLNGDNMVKIRQVDVLQKQNKVLLGKNSMERDERKMEHVVNR
jgi:hypothetical protein